MPLKIRIVMIWGVVIFQSYMEIAMVCGSFDTFSSFIYFLLVYGKLYVVLKAFSISLEIHNCANCMHETSWPYFILLLQSLLSLISHRFFRCAVRFIVKFSFSICVDLISKAIQDLLALVKLLREEVSHQSNEIGHLRRLIENCAGCREPEPVHMIKESCATANPCFTGVHCYETSTGVRCGRCPSGRWFYTLSFFPFSYVFCCHAHQSWNLATVKHIKTIFFSYFYICHCFYYVSVYVIVRRLCWRR